MSGGMVILVVLLVAFVVAAILKTRGEPAFLFPYNKVNALFTPAERSFYGVLVQAIGDDFVAFGKVRVADVLVPSDALNPKSRRAAFNRISAKHFDFVLCAPSDLAVLCVIELNDKSHSTRRRAERDEFLESACRIAGLPLITFPAQAVYTLDEIADKIALTISTFQGANERRKGLPRQLRIEPK